MDGYKKKTDFVWQNKRHVHMYARITKGSGHRISELQISFCVCRGVQIEQAGHRMSSRFNFFCFIFF
jgi:hypothetical protein